MASPSGIVGRDPLGPVGTIPVDGLGKVKRKILITRLPAEGADRCEVSSVTTVMSRAVGDMDEAGPRTPEALQDATGHIEVGTLAISANQVDLPHFAGIQDCPDHIVVIIDVDLVPNIFAGVVHARAVPTE